MRHANLTTFPSRVHEAFTANRTTPRLYPIESLTNMSFSKIAFVTNDLHELTFSNHSEFISTLEESLPDYLSPSIIYPSLLIPILLIICILIPLCYCVKRALTLYLHLKVAKSAQARASVSPASA